MMVISDGALPTVRGLPSLVNRSLDEKEASNGLEVQGSGPCRVGVPGFKGPHHTGGG